MTLRNAIARLFQGSVTVLIVALLFVLMGSYRTQIVGNDFASAGIKSGGSLLQQVLMITSFVVGLIPILVRPVRAARVAFRVWPLYLMPLLALVSAIWSVDPRASAFKAMVLIGVYLFGIGVNTAYGPSQAVRIFIAAGCTIVIFSIITVIAFPMIGVHQADDANQSVHFGSWRGVMSHRTALGQFCALFLIFIFGFRRRIPVIISVPVAAGAILCIVMGHSSGAIISLVIGLISFLVVRIVINRGAKAQSILMVAAVVIAGANEYIINTFGDALLGVLGKDSSLTGRTDIWDYLIRGTQGHEAIGQGYYAGVQLLISINPYMREVANAQSGWLDIYIAYGYLGLISIPLSLFYLIIIMFSTMNKIRQIDSEFESEITDGISFSIAMIVVVAQMSIGESFYVENNNYLQPFMALLIPAFVFMATNVTQTDRYNRVVAQRAERELRLGRPGGEPEIA